jgi:tetratricopeptide (TPR) repeat protein
MSPVKVALIATILAFAAAAEAQDAGKAKAAAPQPQSAATPPQAADPRAAAAAQYREGVAAFEAGKFAEALAAFTEAYNLSSETDLLYNLGVCSEKVGDREKAKAYYQLYLEEKPDAKDAAEVKGRLAALGGVKPATPTPTPAPAAAPIPAADAESTLAPTDGERPRNPNAGPALVMGLGALVVVTGALTGASAYKKYKDLESTCSPDCAAGKVDGVKGAAIAADVQFAVGGAAVVAGFLWWLLKTRHEESAAVDVGASAGISAAPFTTADGGGVSLAGRF